MLDALESAGIKVDLVVFDASVFIAGADQHVASDFLKSIWSRLGGLGSQDFVTLSFERDDAISGIISSNSEHWRYNLIWDYVSATGLSLYNERPLQRHEIISVFGNTFSVYNPQVEGWPQTRDRLDTMALAPYYGTSVLTYRSSADSTGFLSKPHFLMRHLVRSYTDSGAVVLDMTAGVTQAGFAAVESGRNYIGLLPDQMISSYTSVLAEELGSIGRRLESPLDPPDETRMI
jgi:hypothetical protein